MSTNRISNSRTTINKDRTKCTIPRKMKSYVTYSSSSPYHFSYGLSCGLYAKFNSAVEYEENSRSNSNNNIKQDRDTTIMHQTNKKPNCSKQSSEESSTIHRSSTRILIPQNLSQTVFKSSKYIQS